MKNRLQVKVSSFKNAKDTAPVDVILYDWLTSDRYKPLVEKVRLSPNDAAQKELKSRLPFITPSGQFTHRNNDGQTTHSGFICIDIDSKDNTELSDFKDLTKLVSPIDCVAYCSKSAGGKGFFILIPISNPEKHKEHFKSLEIDFARCGIKIDPSGSDVTRLRFYSWDPERYINLNAKTYNKILAPQLATKGTYSTSPAIARVSALIDAIEDSLTDITGNYPQWFQIGCALSNEFGEDPGREFFHRVSQYSDTYEHAIADRQFTACLKGLKSSTPIHINTLFHFAKLNGILLNGPEVDFKEAYTY